MRFMNLRILIVCMSLLLVPVLFSSAEESIFVKDANSAKKVKVVRLIKSDLVILENGQKIRLIGVKGFDAPRKMNRPVDEYGFVIEEETDPTTSLEDSAYEFAQEIMEQKNIRVEYDVKTIDDEGYTLAYVFLMDGTLVNGELLRHGYAHLHLQPPNLKYADQLREAYREARFEKRGIHAE